MDLTWKSDGAWSQLLCSRARWPTSETIIQKWNRNQAVWRDQVEAERSGCWAIRIRAQTHLPAYLPSISVSWALTKWQAQCAFWDGGGHEMNGGGTIIIEDPEPGVCAGTRHRPHPRVRHVHPPYARAFPAHVASDTRDNSRRHHCHNHSTHVVTVLQGIRESNGPWSRNWPETWVPWFQQPLSLHFWTVRLPFSVDHKHQMKRFLSSSLLSKINVSYLSPICCDNKCKQTKKIC